MTKLQGRLLVSERNGLKVHSYISPAASFFVNTQCIELADRLVVIDAQFLTPCALEARQAFEAIGKPIDRVIVTHGHPDHWFGLSHFADLPIHALAGVTEMIRTIGAALRSQYHANMGALVDSRHVVPQFQIGPGQETIAGVRFDYEEISGAEAGLQLLIRLPDHGIVIGQDFFYHDVHLYLETLEFDGWIAVLQRLIHEHGSDLVLCGHGEPGQLSPIAEKNLLYLRFARELYKNKMEFSALKEQLLRAFPTFTGENIIDLWTRLAFAARS